MMEEISLHLLDLLENSLRGEAGLVSLRITEDPGSDRLTIDIDDDGRGIPPELLDTIFSPFSTSRTERRVGLGLSFFQHAARQTGGDVTLTSSPGVGTKVHAVFGLSHPDRQPMGDLGATLATFMAGSGVLRVVLSLTTEKGSGEVDSGELTDALGRDCFCDGTVLAWFSERINELRVELGASP